MWALIIGGSFTIVKVYVVVVNSRAISGCVGTVLEDGPYLQRLGAYAIFRAWAQRVSFSTITSASTV